MEELLPFILLWIIITIFNLLSKRLKKAKKSLTPSTTPAPGSPPKGEIPPSFQEILGAPKQKESPTIQNREDFEEDEEVEAKTYEKEELAELSLEKQQREETKDTLEKDQVAESAIEKKIEEKFQDRIEKKKLHKLKPRSLKMAVIWKEILDKPISLRRIREGRNIFLK